MNVLVKLRNWRWYSVSPRTISATEMKIYKALIEGTNCWANFEGISRRYGFATTRFAKGNDATQAAAAVRQKRDNELSSILLNEEGDIPEIIFKELSEIDEQAACDIPNSGCTWYPDDHPTPN
jgi:hypothetical protein